MYEDLRQNEDVTIDTVGVGGFVNHCGIRFTVETKERVEAVLEVCPDNLQPWGVLHGGATCTLLETVASRAAEYNTDLDKERPFGVEVHLRHKKPGKKGIITGIAELDRIEGNKQYWGVRAVDEEGDIVSDGYVMTKIVSLERLAQKEAEAAAAKAAQ